MQEDLKKNFVLLSKVAKEKKYAQEYLGLLARRGDLGSIRIGKRWYTTWDWFLEFEKDIEVKKAEMKIEERAIEPVKMAVASFSRVERKFPTVDPARNKSCDSLRLVRNSNNLNLRGRIPYPARVSDGVDLRKTAPIQVRKVEKKILEAREELKIRNEAREFSPSFLPESSERFSFFSKFAFGASLVLLFFLLFGFGFSHKKEILKLAGFESGMVAGAYNSKVSLSAVRNSSMGYLGDKEDKVRENISLSRAVLRAAVEKENK